jgi:Kef-type K+ transport system membrane component KefB
MNSPLARIPVPPLGSSSLLLFLTQIGVLLLLALLLGRLAERLKMPALVGELCAGVFLGPSVLEQVAPGGYDWLFPRSTEQYHMLDAVGQLGVLLLVGMTGAHLDLGSLRRRTGAIATISGLGLVIPLGLGIAAGYALPQALLSSGTDHAVLALFLGVAMCVSAIPVIAKIFMDMNILHRDIAQLALTVGMIDDMFGWFMLSVVSAMATTGLSVRTISLSLAYVLLVVAVAATIGGPLVRGAFRLVRSSQTATPTIAAAAVLILLSAAGTHALGLEAVLGAFLCGIVVRQSGGHDRYRLEPLRTTVMAVFAPIFFAIAGLRIDMTSLARPAVALAALLLLVVAIIGKFLGAYLGARLNRLDRWEAVALGAGMNARGVIEVIVAMVGLRLGVLNSAAFTIIVLIAVLTSLMAPPILRLAMARIRYTDREVDRLRTDEDGLSREVGSGLVG